MEPRWHALLLALFIGEMLAISGATENHRVARDEAAGLGAILETAKDVTNPEKVRDTIQVLTGMLGGETQDFLGTGRRRRDLYNPSKLVRMEDSVDALDSGEVNWRVARVPGKMGKSGVETSGISTPSDASSERKRRAAQMDQMSSMMPGGMDPEEHKQKALEMMQTGAQASGMTPPQGMPQIPGTERKRRAAQLDQMSSMMPAGMDAEEYKQKALEMMQTGAQASGMTPPQGMPQIPGRERKRRAAQMDQMSGGMTPPSSMSDGMTPPSSMSDGMTPPSSMSSGMTPPSSMSSGVTPPSSMSNGMTPSSNSDDTHSTQNGQTHAERAKPRANNRGKTSPSSEKKRNRRQSMEDMTEETQTKRSKHPKHGGKGNKQGKGKH